MASSREDRADIEPEGEQRLRSGSMTATTIGKSMSAAEINARMSEIGSQLAKLPCGTHAKVVGEEWYYLRTHYDRALTTGTTLEPYQP